MVGADRLGQFEGVRVAVDHDQFRRGQGLEHLDADVPQAARADDDARPVARAQPLGGLGGGVIGGQAGVGQGRDVGRLQ